MLPLRSSWGEIVTFCALDREDSGTDDSRRAAMETTIGLRKGGRARVSDDLFAN